MEPPKPGDGPVGTGGAPPDLSAAEYARLVRITLLWTPPGALLAFVLAAVQGAEWWICFLLAGVMAVGCLAAAALIRLRGSKAAGDAAWIALLLRVLARR